MNLNLSPENEQFIECELEFGTYKNRDELIDEAVRLLKQRRDLQREVQAGIDSGDALPGEVVFERLEARQGNRSAIAGMSSPA